MGIGKLYKIDYIYDAQLEIKYKSEGNFFMQNTYSKQSVTAELAQCLIIAAIEKSREIGKPMTIAIADESGNLKALTRMDGAALVSIKVAQDKAYTAAANAWGHATHEIYNAIKDDPVKLLGVPKLSRYVLLGGGFPLRIGNVIVGAIGVSGGTAEQDMEVAKAAMQQCGI